MILVDTSAWIEFFRGRDPFASAVDRQPTIGSQVSTVQTLLSLQPSVEPAVQTPL